MYLSKIILILITFLTVSSAFKFSSSRSLGDIPEKMFAGEVHYSRIPVEYWEHRIRMIKAMGLNSLSVYVMWNYH